MTDHARFQDDLKAYADDELPWPHRLAVRRHLTHCASCREELTQRTQIAEDLRASEPADALDPALRAKILGMAPNPNDADAVGAPLAAPSSPSGPSARGRNRLAVRWALAGAALAAWFVFFPVFQHVRENAQSPALAPGAYASKPPPPAAPPPPKAVHMTVRLSDREAGVPVGGDTDGPLKQGGGGVSLQVKNPNSQYQDAQGLEHKVFANNTSGNVRTSDGNIQTYDEFSPLTTFNASTAVPQRQVHKEATIGVRVANPEATSDKVADMVKETGGFVAANNLSTGDDGLKSAELTVKVPVTQFETFLGQVARLGSVQSKNVTGEDITEKKSDADQTENVLEGDVQNSEARLKALGSRAKWHDEQATRDLRTQLAESRARLILLKRMAALSTVTIDLSQTPKPPAAAPVTGGFLNGLKASTHDAVGSLVSSASALVALAIWLLAYAPLWIPALLVGRYGLREYRKRSAV